MKNVCPICNFCELYDPPYDNDGYGSDEICPCCGFQFGYDDFPNKIEGQNKWRTNWINSGCQWFSKTRTQPQNWSGINQCNNIDQKQPQKGD